jgi:uncharacterized OsmC-like protein
MSPYPKQPDQALASILANIASEFDSPAAQPEQVSVHVQRLGRFTHLASTQHGLEFKLDEPVGFGGTGESADPAEQLLAALCASLSVTMTAHAAMRGLVISDLQIAAGGAIDGPSFFNPFSAGRPGILDIHLQLELTSPMTQSEADSLLDIAVQACPVLQTLVHKPEISLELKGPK